MAAKRELLGEDDELTEYILHQVAKCVRYDALELLATDLEITETQFIDIKHSDTNLTVQKFKVLNLGWNIAYDASPFKVKHLIERIVKWRQEGYVDADVWTNLQSRINPELFPTSDTQAPSGGGIALRALPATCRQYVLPTTEEIALLQKRTKQSLNLAWKNCMTHDWIPRDKAKTFPLKQFYVGMRWTKRVKGALTNHVEHMTSIYDVLQVAEETPTNILIEADPGMGKTCSMALLALDWSKRNHTALNQFDFVFLIPLRFVDQISTLAELIITQHAKLEADNARHIQAILNGRTNHNVLLMLDGYDEYTRGTNKDVDKAIESTIGDCFLLLTSRPGNYVSKETRDKMDGEIIIEGFSLNSIMDCATLYLGSEERCDEMLEQAEKTGIDVLLHVPIILLMVSVVFIEQESLPKTKTEIVGTIFRLAMDRTTLKTFGAKSSELRNLDGLLNTLGEFSWDALQNDVRQLLLNKDELTKESPDVLKLGLLVETGIDVATVRERPNYVCFQHKLLQEYAGARTVTRKLERADNIKTALKVLFPTWHQILKHREVVLFSCGMMSDPTPLVNHVYHTYVEMKQFELNTEDDLILSKEEKALFRSLYDESTVPLPGRALHNAFLNYYCHYSDFVTKDTSPVYAPSGLYWFKHIKEAIPWKGVMEGEAGKSNCAVYVNNSAGAETNNLLSLCRKISQQQPMSLLCLYRLECPDAEDNDVFTLAKDASVVAFRDCKLPQDVVQHVLYQLQNCCNVSTLDLAHTSLGSISSFDSLGKMTTLVGLDLWGTEMSPEFCASVGKQLKCLTNLEFLNLSRDEWRNPECVPGELVADAIKAWGPEPKLTHLYLSDCDFPKEALAQILEALSTCKRLIHLDMSHNKLNSCGAPFLETLRNWGTNPAIQCLLLRDCDMPRDTCETLVQILSTCLNLTHVDLAGNDVTCCEEDFLAFHLHRSGDSAQRLIFSDFVSKDDLKDVLHKDKVFHTGCFILSVSNQCKPEEAAQETAGDDNDSKRVTLGFHIMHLT